MTHTVTYIFLFFPTMDNCEEGGGLRLMNIQAKVFPVRSVGQPNSIMGEWQSPQVGPIFSHTVLLLLLPFPPFTLIYNFEDPELFEIKESLLHLRDLLSVTW